MANVDFSPKSGRNCLGALSRESGHNRVPAPPQRITGMINILSLLSQTGFVEISQP
jgi:hypothetical protein